jgi:hypothetical protein
MSIIDHKPYVEVFHHDAELKALVIEMYDEGKLRYSEDGCLKLDCEELTIRFRVPRMRDVKLHESEFKVRDIGLHTWVGKWTSHTKVSHTTIDKSTLITLLRLNR